MMIRYTKAALMQLINDKQADCQIIIENADLSSMDLSQLNLSNITFCNVNFSHADFSNTNFSNTLNQNCCFENANFFNANLSSGDFRGCNLNYANLSGANLHFALLENAQLDKVTFDETTQHFALHCPEQGAFIAWKKCYNFRIVQLLIPSDAKRSSATDNTCRCDKAKVLSVKSIDEQHQYRSAISLVTDCFIYHAGEMVYANYYNEDRWSDSTYGIHFFMTRQEAIDY